MVLGEQASVRERLPWRRDSSSSWIVKGLRMATVAKCKFDLEICGGIYVNEPCVIDKHNV